MKSKEEIRDWLLENAVSEYGNLLLRGLDFSDFDGNVYIDYMKVKKDLHQHGKKLKEVYINSTKKLKVI